MGLSSTSTGDARVWQSLDSSADLDLDFMEIQQFHIFDSSYIPIPTLKWNHSGINSNTGQTGKTIRALAMNARLFM